MIPLENIAASSSTSAGNDVASLSKAAKRNHADEPKSGNVTYKRRKALTACNVCRARKTKCDNELPRCGFCRSTQGECHYSTPPLSQYDQATQSILQRLDSLESNLGSLIKGSNQETRYAQHSLHYEAAPDTPNGRQATTVAGNITANYGLEAPPSSATLLRASSETSIEAMLAWPVFRDKLRLVGSEQNKHGLGDNNLRLTAAENSDMLEDTMLRPEVVSPLVESFIANNLPCNPILQPAAVRTLVLDVVNNGLSWDGHSCLALVILALGSISSPAFNPMDHRRIDTPQHNARFHNAEKYFWASQLRTGNLIQQRHLLAAQCAFFGAVYLSYTMRTLAAWKAFAQAGTNCLAYLRTQGLMKVTLQEAGNETAPKWDNAEQLLLDDSLYWVILKGEAELCVELGLPASALHEIPYPHIFPRPPNLGASSLGVTEIPERFSDQSHLATGWFYYLGEIALKRLQNRVIQHRFGVGSYRGDAERSLSDVGILDDVGEFDEQLEQWFQHLPEPLKFSDQSVEELHDHLRWVLRGHRLDVIELLRFPAIRWFLAPGPRSEPSRGDSSPAVLQRVREYLENACYRIEVHVEEFYHRHQGTWLTMRGCTRSALALLGTDLVCGRDEGLRSAVLPPTWRRAVREVYDMLVAWSGESNDISYLETVIRSLIANASDDPRH